MIVLGFCDTLFSVQRCVNVNFAKAVLITHGDNEGLYAASGKVTDKFDTVLAQTMYSQFSDSME